MISHLVISRGGEGGRHARDLAEENVCIWKKGGIHDEAWSSRSSIVRMARQITLSLSPWFLFVLPIFVFFIIFFHLSFNRVLLSLADCPVFFQFSRTFQSECREQSLHMFSISCLNSAGTNRSYSLKDLSSLSASPHETTNGKSCNESTLPVCQFCNRRISSLPVRLNETCIIRTQICASTAASEGRRGEASLHGCPLNS